MNSAQEKMMLEHLRQRLEEAYDRQNWQDTLRYSRLIDRITAEQMKQSAHV